MKNVALAHTTGLMEQADVQDAAAFDAGLACGALAALQALDAGLG